MNRKGSTRPRPEEYASKTGYSKPRAFTHNISPRPIQVAAGQSWSPLTPVVLDITAGGGSIPFEAGRLGFRTIANELNPVAGLILRATCEWPQKYGWELLEHFQDVKGRFLERVRELTADLYPEEPQPEAEPGNPPQIRTCGRKGTFGRTFSPAPWNALLAREQSRYPRTGGWIPRAPASGYYPTPHPVPARSR